MKPLHIQVQETKDALAAEKPRSRRRVELELRPRDLRLKQLQVFVRENRRRA